MKTLNVSAAVIIREGRVLAVKRKGNYESGGWEFPGGKLEEGETAEEALIREIREELGCLIAIDSWLMKDEYDYETFHLSMDCFLCGITAGELVLKEHMAARWLTKNTLFSVDWLPADLDLIKKLEAYLPE